MPSKFDKGERRANRRFDAFFAFETMTLDQFAAANRKALTEAIEIDDDGFVRFRGELVGRVEETIGADGFTVWLAFDLDNTEVTCEVTRIDSASILVTDKYGNEFSS